MSDVYIFAVGLDIDVPAISVGIDTPPGIDVNIETSAPIDVEVAVEDPSVSVSVDDEGIEVEV